jgi:hypothetical protein
MQRRRKDRRGVARGAACSIILLAASCGLAFAPARARDEDGADESGGAAPGPVEAPLAEAEPIELRGWLVCLEEEMQRLHGVAIPPVHQHSIGLRVEPAPAAPAGPDARAARARATLGYYSIPRTHFAKALFEDGRYKEHLLVVSGRVFPGTALLDLTRFRWIRDGKEREVFYWCEVCAIKTLDPDRCACCQGEVEFREIDAE